MATLKFVGRRVFVTSRCRRLMSSSGAQKHYELVIIGGGSGGCTVAAKFCRRLGKGNVAVIEPSETHYYQPLWTLVGGGIKTLEQSKRPMGSVLPKHCDLIQSKAVTFDPANNTVTTGNGQKIGYSYLVVAAGFQLRCEKIKGLEEAFRDDPTVVSNYLSWRVDKTFPALKAFKGGNAIFTMPDTPIKCPGAPQKIVYLAEDLFRKNGVRNNTNVIYNTGLNEIFSVKKYAESLLKVVEERNIQVNYKRNLVEVCSENKEAIFENLETGEKETLQYSFLHVVPPMSPPDELQSSPLVNAAGFVDVDRGTLQHTKYSNVFSLGDCSSAPTKKTAAAVACQSGVLEKNLTAVMAGTDLKAQYNGYTSCPLVTSPRKCILAEFDYNLNPVETMPINQGKERFLSYLMNRDLVPLIYWSFMLRGRWNGPAFIRKALRPGLRDGKVNN